MNTESIIKKQQGVAEEIDKLLKNFGRDGPARKTRDYLRQRKLTLQGLWHEFVENHALLEAHLTGDHPYMDKDLFGATRKLYQKTMNTLEEWTERPTTKGTTDPGQTTRQPQIQDTRTTVDYSLPPVDELATNKDEPPRTFQQPSSLAVMSSFPKLPPVKIPRFNGDYKEWKPFHDIFCNVIHNNPHLSNVERMQYLLYHLEGDAKRVVSHLQLTSANYQTAFSLIQARFNNNRRIITSYINTIMDTKKVDYRSQDDIIMLYDTLRECLEALKALDCQTDTWGPLIVCIVIRKLDTESLRIFEESLSIPREMPSTEELLDFLEKRYQVLDCIKNSRQPRTELAPTQQKKRVFHTLTTKECNFCNKEHAIYHCPDFKKLSVEERRGFVSKNGLCENCLSHNQDSKCRTKRSCFFCHKKHHTLLHQVTQLSQGISNHNRVILTQSYEPLINAPQDDVQERAVVTSHHKATIPNVLLPTAMVKVINPFGQTEYLRALVDPGSQVSLITEDAVQSLKLTKERIRTTIFGVGDSTSTKSSSMVNVCIKTKTNEILRINALVLAKLSSLLPDSKITRPSSSQLKNIILADPSFDQPEPIDLLLGADVYARILQDGFIPGQPAAQKTSLGWILFGSITNDFAQTNRVSSFISIAELDKKLENFWEMDSDTTPVENNSSYCDEHFRSTHRRDATGRYIVKLPFKSDTAQIGYSKGAAIARLLQMERKLSQNPDQQSEYNSFLREYEQLGHMSPCSPHIGDEHKVFYLPHHGVIKADSTTTKLRVVFDASCKSSSNLSLNDCLHNGPNIQQDLRSILLRWRIHRYVFTADIEKMFRQIKVDHKDRNFQRILWRENPSDHIQEYKLNTVTYGTASATFLSVRTLKQLAEDEGHSYPIAKRVLKNDFYVDDMLSGADTKEEAHLLQSQIISLLRKGCFNLRKWTSNDQALLKSLPDDLLETGALEIGKDDVFKTLGIHWSPQEDVFHYKINFKKDTTKLTKRILASKIASIFDPLGFLAPITVTAKLIMQNLCSENVDWDQAPSAEITNTWNKLEAQLEGLQLIKIPRWNHHRLNYEIELHGFCDASEKAHAAAIYSRTTDSFGNAHVTLLTAKTRVTPLKQKPTLPRLELCGALLLARLLKSTIAALGLAPAIKTYAWCDSEIVLHWISKNPAELEKYVENRVREIQELDNSCVWRHVRSMDNPADVASRGIQPNKLPSHNLWWRGPLWLAQSSEAWPIQKINFQPTNHLERGVTMMVQPRLSNEVFTCSTYIKQLRTIAYCRRFINNCKSNASNHHGGHLTSSEIQEAKKCLILLVQGEEFSPDIRLLKQNKPLKRDSKIVKLHPFLDLDGLLRVGGRIQNSNLSMEAKHQVLLPAKHIFTDMVIDHSHHQTLHGGVQQTLSNVRQQFWIVDGKRRVQGRINKCIRCLRHRTHNKAPLMGNLPAIRVSPSPPFSHMGIDYAGPFLTKLSKARSSTSVKGYVAVFVCMTTKAVHLELVTELTTDAFLAAYKRFVARRGVPKEIMTDNGTNFVGAKNKLHKDLLVAIKESNKRAAELTASDGTEWKFIPPASPHFGGIWEAAVKSMKQHLKRIIGETLLTYEEFATILAQVEACLNSRPIGQHSCDPSDLEPLTPGHFLIGRPLLAPPEPDISDQDTYQRWKLLTKLYQNIWKRWSQEYLSSLQQRTKWITEGENPRIGELVLLKEDNLAPQKWPLGRIVELHPGEDGVVRVVSVQFQNGIKKRPLIKLCQLPIEAYSSQPKKEPSAVKSNVLLTKKARKEKQRIDSEAESPDNVDTSVNPKKRKVRIAPCTWAPRLAAFLSILQSFTFIFGQPYEILHPSPGYYIENLGSAQIKRGNLRVQLSYPIEQIIEDQTNINATWTQVEEMCEKTRSLTQVTHCETLLKHLDLRKNILEKHIQQILEGVDQGSRSKRGILGSLLTSIFGVNDQVYADIDNLQHNQQQLLYTQNQHTLLLDTKLNQSNIAMIEKLKKFDLRLAQVISTVNDMSKWYRSTDHNRIAIEVLAAYLSAEDYLEELSNKYDNLLNAIYNKSHLLRFITLHDINDAVNNASKRIGPNLAVLNTPQDRLEVEANDNSIIVYGYLDIVERASYELIHVTPIPQLIKNEVFVMPEPELSTLAVNFNGQSYFTLDDAQLKACSIHSQHSFICTPTIIHDIQNDPSCVLDEIYNRYPKTKCHMHQFRLTGPIWKALMMRNTWLFITNGTTLAAIFCHGIRQEELLNSTGILHLNEGCYIKTKEVTLKGAIEYDIKVIASHIKNSPIIHKFSQDEAPPAILKPGLLLKPNEQLVTYATQEYLHPILWRRSIARHYAAFGSVVVALVIITIIIRYRRLIRKVCCCISHKETQFSRSQSRRDSTGENIRQRFEEVLEVANLQASPP